MRASVFALLPLFFFLLADAGASRKDPAEYWTMVMKDEAMPQAIQGVLHDDPMIQSETKPQSHNDLQSNHEEKFIEDFEPRQSATSYNNGDLGTHKEKFTNDFELKPSATSYKNSDFSGQNNKFTKYFEPRHSATSYSNDNLSAQENIYTKDFEPRPSATSYINGDLGHQENKFTKDLPSLLAMMM
ncbi:organ-specific protein P4-like [Prosopis cineraria]|uniref:organ-specific protein P4-like n=1 Tax=Prosopis cineraria TaxID=364024 RepID=UPI00241047E2|nr:organ-specific protein P4-like [Prosopis cineraria]